jgi:hypothetical protein
VLVEAARVLADQLDQAPDHSPLWGRYTALLDSLVAAQADREAERSLSEVQGTLRAIGDAEACRAERCRQAREWGDEAEIARWCNERPQFSPPGY